MKLINKLLKLEILAGAVFSFVNTGQMIYYNCKVPPKQEIIETLKKENPNYGKEIYTRADALLEWEKEKVFHHYNLVLLGCAISVTGFYGLRLVSGLKSEDESN